MMLNGVNYEVIKEKSERKNKNEYYNEVIIIDIDTFERFKLSFYTSLSKFEMIRNTEICKDNCIRGKYIKWEKYTFKIAGDRDIILKDDVFFNIEKLD